MKKMTPLTVAHNIFDTVSNVRIDEIKILCAGTNSGSGWIDSVEFNSDQLAHGNKESHDEVIFSLEWMNGNLKQ